MTIIEEIKQSFRRGSVLTKLIYINIAVFLAVNIVYLIFFLFNITHAKTLQGSFISWFAVPADINILVKRPWTLISYMFLHENLLHILFNMLWLFWFGKIFLQFLDEKKLLGLYIIGGLIGAAFFIAAFNLFPVFRNLSSVPIALGASAAVMAIVVAISFFAPDYRVYLIFIGPVKLKYIALVMIVLDLLSIASYNAGGHIAHLGGAFIGWIYAVQLKRNKDFLLKFNNFTYGLFNWKYKPMKKTKMKVTYKKPKSDLEFMADKAKKQKEIDKILDKIAKSGYDSLTKQEKEFLFKESKK
ncbi:MAG: rhomboid family intramembrane serine protease [Marinilabiliales bacterium]